ncbi:hypothetical protein [Brevibacterium otitidis]|uniref:Antitoxin HicB n=1 Tax=Brevibacterium otitidis TaxID=53364 RepID=A0ABV5WZX3_9MICO|nr:hypothetical protein GCM10023233_28260 [Brevibacterium otitidis]
MTTYTAKVTRSGDWWAVTVPEVPGLFTQGHSLAEVVEMVRDALTLYPDVEPDPDSATIIFESDDEAAHAAVVASKANAAAERAKVSAMRDMAIAARRLVSQGTTYRDVAMLLGVSHQRVQQLVKRVA